MDSEMRGNQFSGRKEGGGAVSVQFIEALARELRLLSAIPDQPVIPLRRELELGQLGGNGPPAGSDVSPLR